MDMDHSSHVLSLVHFIDIHVFTHWEPVILPELM